RGFESLSLRHKETVVTIRLRPFLYAVELGIIRTLIVLRSINNKQKHRLIRNTIMFALPPNDAFAQHKARTVGSESLSPLCGARFFHVRAILMMNPLLFRFAKQ
ncbi:MAG: hypothetical protein IJD70_04430, partial [Clostridia bacterium]|nr:hypothetical protein [Clostridia bacterium]